MQVRSLMKGIPFVDNALRSRPGFTEIDIQVAPRHLAFVPSGSWE